MHSSPSWSPLIADLCARRRTRSAMLLRDDACWTSAASPCFALRPRRRDLRLLLSADCHRATSNRGRLQCVPFALLLVLCSLQPARAASELKDIAKLAELALRRYEPSFKLTGNVSETLVSLLSSLRSSRLSHRLEAVNCSPPFNGSALCKEGAECLSVGDLLQLFPEAAESSVGEALVRLCPVLIFQMQHRSCDFTPSVASRGKTRPTPAQVWGFGMLAVFVISCCSLAGLVIVPFLSHVLYHRLLMVFEGLAVGSLLGSAVFHLIPQAFNLLGQDQEHDYLWKSLIVFLGVYLFYLSDKVMRFIADYRQRRSDEKLETSFGCALANGGVLELSSGDSPVRKNTLATAEPQRLQAHNHEHGIKAGDGIAAVAWMIIFGDGMHNFIDGLSIGAAFSESLLAGASISVAVVCEEFPHELGDFAVLLSAGMSTRQAVVYNFLSALTCFLGLGVGILVGDLTEGAPHIFALAAGMFLYISLVAMMGELNEALDAASKEGLVASVKLFLLQNVGIGMGVALLFLMAKYSEKINFEYFSSLPPGVSVAAASFGGAHDDARAVFGGLGM
ncbi:metal cation symporter ZIP14-like [Dermacentor variabilis]|uniref:metal cation symporter ZIP14-like n=1 Tax=Dermacentor variabilis TaxID=34621 RepID=UPI003F5ADFC8